MATASMAQPAIPRVKGHPLLGNLPGMRHGPLPYFVEVAQQYGGIVRLRFGPRILYLVSDPEGIQRILQENHRNYRKSKRYEVIKLLLGQGLLTSEGDFWLRQRRLIQPAFHRQRIAAFAATMSDEIAALLTRWEPIATQGGTLDVAAEMMRLTLGIVGRTLFSADVSDEADLVGRALTIALEYADERMRLLFAPPPRVPTPRNRRGQAAIRALDGIVYDLIAARRRSGEERGDLLDLLLGARDEETGAAMSDQQVRDEVMTLFLAGHETTANALTWTWYLLAQHSEVAARLRAETAAVLGERLPTMTDLPALPYGKMVLDEVLRLYPPAWAIGRAAIGPDTVLGYTLPARANIALSPYVTQRLPTLWPDPEHFDPERFRPEAVAARHRFAYFPFGGGPRLCIGRDFALLEAQLAIAAIVSRYHLDLVPGHPVVPQPVITLRTRHGLRMHVRRQG